MDMQGSGYRAAEATAAQHVRLAGGGAVAPVTPVATHHRDELLVGEVMDISGSASRILLDAATLHKLAASTDPAVAMAGQVGAQITVRVGHVWLLASIRRSEEHTSEPQSLMRTSYAVLRLKKKTVLNLSEDHFDLQQIYIFRIDP